MSDNTQNPPPTQNPQSPPATQPESPPQSLLSRFKSWINTQNPNHANSSTGSQVRGRSTTILKITSGLAVLLLLTNFFLLFLSSTEAKQLAVTKEQIITTQTQSSDLEAAIEYLNSESTSTEMIKKALPDEEELQTEFIQTMEFVAQRNASTSSIRFSALAPTGSGPSKYLPFTINLTTDTPNFHEFLKRLEKLPYIIEITSIDQATQTAGSNVWSITLSARVYVRDPFKTPTNNQRLSIPLP